MIASVNRQHTIFPKDKREVAWNYLHSYMHEFFFEFVVVSSVGFYLCFLHILLCVDGFAIGLGFVPFLCCCEFVGQY